MRSENGLTPKKPQNLPGTPQTAVFDRSRPNQLWLRDIMTFRLAGRNA
jgi:hypothetical protein